MDTCVVCVVCLAQFYYDICVCGHICVCGNICVFVAPDLPCVRLAQVCAIDEVCVCVCVCARARDR